MKYSFAIAALFAVVSVQAINLSADPSDVPSAGPVVKKEAPKKDEEAIKAKFEAVKEKKEAQDEKAEKATGEAMKAEDDEAERKKKAYQTAYWGHIGDQKTETQRIKDLRERPEGAKSPNESHEVGGGSSAGEHWTSSMPDHILDNKDGPTAAWDSPAPKKKDASKEPATEGK